MSKITDIKYRIDQLDGGTFQNLCDAYLTCRGYGTGYSLGMMTGTSKTAKGNPDSYFLTKSGKYVFVMYTTQKADFTQKALEDLEKCFDQNKTGLSPHDIAEIVYCHTCGRLSPGDHQTLYKFCEDRNAVLTLIGLDELGTDLYLKYPRLAKDFLNISVDTGQVTSIQEFVQMHDANKMSAPLSTEFLFREDELKSAKEKIFKSDVLILSGPAGVGKTKLALHLCKEISEEEKYEIVCIKSNKLELYDDLISSIETGKNYVVLIDDANELTGLHLVLDLLPIAAIGQKCVKKIIITVRDYARQQVIQEVSAVEKPEVLKVGLLTDDEIRQLIESSFGIRNHLYLDRIVAIAEGNARLAMLAGKVAAETEQISSIQDATELYAHYYGKQIDEIIKSKTGVVSAGIMAFFQVLRLDNLERLHPIFDSMNLTEEQFILDLKQFHTLELVDLRHDLAARISDQSFSNYLIKYVFIDKKPIPLSQMIQSSFFISKKTTISACHILLNVFSDKVVHDYVKEQINIVWDNLKSDSDNFFPFFKVFYLIRPTESLMLIKELIDAETPRTFDVQSFSFSPSEREKNIDDDIVNLLCGFSLHPQLPEAIELLLLYYHKRPDLFEQIYSAFVSRFGVDKDSYRTGYYTQKIVVEQLSLAVKTARTDDIYILFVKVAEEFLKLSFSSVESSRHNTFIFYTIQLSLHKVVLEYREKLLRQLYDLYNNGICQGEIEYFLLNYCKGFRSDYDYEIVRKDLAFILSFFALFSPENLLHCLIAEHIKQITERVNYDFNIALIPFLNSRKYKVYDILKPKHEKLRVLKHQEYTAWYKNQIQDMVQSYSHQDFQYLFQICNEYLKIPSSKNVSLASGLEYAIDAFSSNSTLYIDIITDYLDYDTPFAITPYGILRNLFTMMPAENVKVLIDSHNFIQKSAWLWSFYVELPMSQISVGWVNDFLLYLENIPLHKQISLYRPLNEIENFKCIDKDIILKASRVILSHYSESPAVFHNYFHSMIDFLHVDPNVTISEYKDDIPLLEDIYIKCVSYAVNDDYDGDLLSRIIHIDPSFLYRYLNKTLEEIHRFSGQHEALIRRLEFIWNSDMSFSYMTQISNYIFEESSTKYWEYSSIIGQLLLHDNNEIDVEKKQEQWIQDTIKGYYWDQDHMTELFHAIAQHSEDRRRFALETFLSLNREFEMFKKLPLEASDWGGCGSMIPYMHERISYLSSLLPLLSGIQFLKHKQKVEDDIKVWERRIKDEEIKELLEYMG